MLLDINSIEKGTPIPVLIMPVLTRTMLARFCGAIDDYNPVYLDDKVAIATGKNSVFAPTSWITSSIGRMVQSYFDSSLLQTFAVRMLKLIWPGDLVTCRGLIVDKQENKEGYMIDADVWADNQRGDTVAKGRVIVLVPYPGKKTSTLKSHGIIYNNQILKPKKIKKTKISKKKK